ncbi:MAG: 2,3-bisphosphoglycerate-independent phosphoglycerate mutase [Elusimicrobiota bacterium]
MIGEDKLAKLISKNDSKIVLVVMDGVGDIPDSSGKTALEEASTPNLDELAGNSELGLTIPVDLGITPGSGPAHLSLFGYDPLEHEIGRGVLEALGIGLKLTGNDLAARANFATRSSDGIIEDRRAGRIPTEENERLCAKLKESLQPVNGVDIKVYPGKEHRFVVVFRGEGLSDNLLDADPEVNGLKERPVEALDKESEKAKEVANKFMASVNRILKDENPANSCLLRGMAKVPGIRTFEERYGLKSCAIATYPMYKGLSRLVGMDVIEGLVSIEDEVNKLKELYDRYDFFYLHVKKTDSYGEDGNRASKVKVIEEFDGFLPKILKLSPEVICVTADHSTPTPMKSHSWHPNPIMIKGTRMRNNSCKKLAFTEQDCLRGVYGTFHAVDVIQLLLSQAGRLKKFGA